MCVCVDVNLDRVVGPGYGVIMAYCSMLQYIIVYYGILWYIILYYGILSYIMVYDSILGLYEDNGKERGDYY